METIIFATKNKGKIREINEILADMNVNVVSMEEAGITIDVVEDGKTFEENSMKKAVQVMEISGKMKIEVFHRNNLCIAASCCTAFNSKAWAKRRLS